MVDAGALVVVSLGRLVVGGDALLPPFPLHDANISPAPTAAATSANRRRPRGRWRTRLPRPIRRAAGSSSECMISICTTRVRGDRGLISFPLCRCAISPDQKASGRGGTGRRCDRGNLNRSEPWNIPELVELRIGYLRETGIPRMRVEVRCRDVYQWQGVITTSSSSTRRGDTMRRCGRRRCATR